MNAGHVALRMKQSFQSTFASFGLTSNYQELLYEELFILKYHGGYSLFESYSIPVGLRKWLIERLIKQKETEKEQMEKAQKR